METKHTRHTVYHIAYNLVWVTKYRRTVLTDEMQNGLKEILNQTASEQGFDIMAAEAMSDHVHCFISAAYAPSDIVKILKGASARNILARGINLLLAEGLAVIASGGLTLVGSVKGEPSLIESSFDIRRAVVASI